MITMYIPDTIKCVIVSVWFLQNFIVPRGFPRCYSNPRVFFPQECYNSGESSRAGGFRNVIVIFRQIDLISPPPQKNKLHVIIWMTIGYPCKINRPVVLEAQQRYFSYCEILLAIVSQNPFVLVFLGIAQLSRDMLQNGVSHRYAFVKLSSKGGYRTILGLCQPPLKKYRAIWGIAAIVSQYRAIWGH